MRIVPNLPRWTFLHTRATSTWRREHKKVLADLSSLHFFLLSLTKCAANRLICSDKQLKVFHPNMINVAEIEAFLRPRTRRSVTCMQIMLNMKQHEIKSKHVEAKFHHLRRMQHSRNHLFRIKHKPKRVVERELRLRTATKEFYDSRGRWRNVKFSSPFDSQQQRTLEILHTCARSSIEMMMESIYHLSFAAMQAYWNSSRVVTDKKSDGRRRRTQKDIKYVSGNPYQRCRKIVPAVPVTFTCGCKFL